MKRINTFKHLLVGIIMFVFVFQLSAPIEVLATATQDNISVVGNTIKITGYHPSNQFHIFKAEDPKDTAHRLQVLQNTNNGVTSAGLPDGLYKVYKTSPPNQLSSAVFMGYYAINFPGAVVPVGGIEQVSVTGGYVGNAGTTYIKLYEIDGNDENLVDYHTTTNGNTLFTDVYPGYYKVRQMVAPTYYDTFFGPMSSQVTVTPRAPQIALSQDDVTVTSTFSNGTITLTGINNNYSSTKNIGSQKKAIFNNLPYGTYQAIQTINGIGSGASTQVIIPVPAPSAEGGILGATVAALIVGAQVTVIDVNQQQVAQFTAASSQSYLPNLVPGNYQVKQAVLISQLFVPSSWTAFAVSPKLQLTIGAPGLLGGVEVANVSGAVVGAELTLGGPETYYAVADMDGNAQVTVVPGIYQVKQRIENPTTIYTSGWSQAVHVTPKAPVASVVLNDVTIATPFEGAQIALTGTNSTQLSGTATSGQAIFNDLAVGTYQASQTVNSETSQFSNSVVVLPSALQGVGGIFTLTVSGGEPLATVEVYQNEMLVTSAALDASGNFQFTGMTPGNYQVRQVVSVEEEPYVGPFSEVTVYDRGEVEVNAPVLSVNELNVTLQGGTPGATYKLYRDEVLYTTGVFDQSGSAVVAVIPGYYGAIQIVNTPTTFGESGWSNIVLALPVAVVLTVLDNDVTAHTTYPSTIVKLEGNNGVSVTMASAEAQALFADQPVGTYHATQTYYDYESPVSNTVDVLPGLVQATPGHLEATITGAIPGATIILELGEESFGTQTADENGQAVFTELTPGIYQVHQVVYIGETSYVGPSRSVEVLSREAVILDTPVPVGGVEVLTITGAEPGADLYIYQGVQLKYHIVADELGQGTINPATPGVYHVMQMLGEDYSMKSEEVSVVPVAAVLTGGTNQVRSNGHGSYTLDLYTAAGQYQTTRVADGGGEYYFYSLANGPYYVIQRVDVLVYEDEGSRIVTLSAAPSNVAYSNEPYVPDTNIPETIAPLGAPTDESTIDEETTPLGLTKVLAPYMLGYPDKTFRPNQFVTRSEAVTAFVRIMNLTAVNGTSSFFKDVKVNAWNLKFVNAAYEAGLLKGYADGTFRPDQAITRAELATLMVKYLDTVDKTLQPSGITMKDVANHWAAAAINKIYVNTLMKGFADKTFRPEAPITRESFVYYVNDLIGRPKLTGTTSSFNDLPLAWWSSAFVESAANAVEQK